MPDLTEADVTKNGADSGFSFDQFTKALGGLGALAGQGNTLYNQITGKGPTQAAPAPTLAASSVSGKLVAWLPWIIGGGVVLVLAVLFLGRRK